jgi:SOS-response transcriptional repressor LexA
MDTARTTALAQLRVFSALGEPCGILLWNQATGECAVRFRRDWDAWSGEEAEVLAGLAAQVEQMLTEMGPEAFLQWADDCLSNTLLISEPQTALIGRIDRSLPVLYRKLVHSDVRPYQTHLPLLSIRAAAGGFGRDTAASAENWIDVDLPERRSLGEDLFLVRIEGHSMEPDIPDGSLCLFRSYYGGSRKGGIYLVQRVATLDEGGEVTIKRYDSRKRVTEDGWRHDAIEMQPDNPEYQRWQLDEDERYITIAQFLRVIEEREPTEP